MADTAQGSPPITLDRFYRAPKVKGASAFGAQFRGLSIPDVKELGHQFRMIQSDPTAALLEEQRKRRSDGAIPEHVLNAVNFLPVCFLEIGMRQVRAVCKISTEGMDFEQRSGSWSGTGFLVGRNLLLTNHHVLHDIAAATNAWCIFNFQLGVEYTPLDTVGFRLDPKRLFLTSPLKAGLDYTFVWIESAASEKFGTVAMHRSAFTVHPGDFANVVQHPRGRLKELVLQDNQVLQDTGLVLHYASDTESGSSGSPTFNNRWELIALHHASRRNDEGLVIGPSPTPPAYLNEGIKLSAIAADLERRAQGGESYARTVLESFQGVDSLMGFFGGLGRHSHAGASLERLREIYSGENEDIDIGFWNFAWNPDRYQEQLETIAGIIADLNVDIWTLAESTPEMSRELVRLLCTKYKLPYMAASGLEAGQGRPRSAVVIWNTQTIEGERLDWPAGIDEWFDVKGTQFAELAQQAVHGNIFDRYPSLFRFTAKNRPKNAEAFHFHLIPLHLETQGEGSKRQHIAARILGAAIREMVSSGLQGEWMIGGTFNGELATQDLQKLGDTLTPLTAEDEHAGAITYLKTSASLLDHIFVSSALAKTYGADDFIVVARDRELPRYVNKACDERPVLARLSLADKVPKTVPMPPSLKAALAAVSPASPPAAAAAAAAAASAVTTDDARPRPPKRRSKTVRRR